MNFHVFIAKKRMLVVHVLILKLLHHDLRNRLKTPASVFKGADIGRQLGKLFDMSFFFCAVLIPLP